MLDDSGWHRTYWMYGSRFISGWCGYYQAGKSAILMAVSAADGRTLEQYELDNAPVFDRLIAANSRLYMSTIKGQILCMEGR